MGNYLRSKMIELSERYPSLIKEVRGIGLMLGMELHKSGADIVNRLRAEGLLINCTQDTVLRIMPAMTVTKRMIDRAVYLIDQVLTEATK